MSKLTGEDLSSYLNIIESIPRFKKSSVLAPDRRSDCI